jgi:peptidoglycan/xylan/chitin deacetylase (PgdA/CDA1 family)
MAHAERIKHAARVLIASLLYVSGLLHVWQRIALRRKAVVLMYHRVLSPEERRQTGSHPAMVVDTDTFARQMAALKRHFVVLTLEEFADHIQQRIPLPDCSCLVTFDDGWRDNLANALPVLQAQGLPATIFLPVNFIGRRKLFWREALTHLLVTTVLEVRRDARRRARLHEILAPVGVAHVLDLEDPDPRQAVVRAAERMEVGAIERLAMRLASELGVELDGLSAVDGFVNWDQVDEMSRRGISFGGHGAEHLVLSRVTADQAEQEVRRSMEVIGSRFPDSVPTFSYPNGSWTPEVASTVRATGYRLAFTTQPGFVSCDDEPFTLRRVNIHQDMTSTTPLFLARALNLL